MILEPRGCSWSGFRGWVETQDLGFLLRVAVVFCLVTFWTFPPREVNFPGADHFLISHLPQALFNDMIWRSITLTIPRFSLSFAYDCLRLTLPGIPSPLRLLLPPSLD